MRLVTHVIGTQCTIHSSPVRHIPLVHNQHFRFGKYCHKCKKIFLARGLPCEKLKCSLLQANWSIVFRTFSSHTYVTACYVTPLKLLLDECES